MRERASQSRRAQRLLLDAIRAPQALPALPLADWELLVRVARRTRLLGRLEADLRQAGLLEKIPPSASRHLRAARNVIEHRKRLVAWEIDRILWAIKGIDAPLILLKGAAYVVARLPSARGRIFADIDLLLPENFVEEVEERLIARGWMRLLLHPYDDRYYRVWMHEIPPLRHRERGTEIDIHHRLLPRTSCFRSEPGELLAAAVPMEAGSRVHVLAPADMVLHALVHLFLDGDSSDGLRLRDLLDVHDLLCHFGPVPGFWEGLVPRARELGFERLLYYGLRFAQRIFGTPIPVEVMERISDAAPNWLAGKILDRVFTLALLPEHPDYRSQWVAFARQLVYLRAHWLRMPPVMLVRHLAVKAYLRLRGVRKSLDLTRLDLKQQ